MLLQVKFSGISGLLLSFPVSPTCLSKPNWVFPYFTSLPLFLERVFAYVPNIFTGSFISFSLSIQFQDGMLTQLSSLAHRAVMLSRELR